MKGRCVLKYFAFFVVLTVIMSLLGWLGRDTPDTVIRRVGRSGKISVRRKKKTG